MKVKIKKGSWLWAMYMLDKGKCIDFHNYYHYLKQDKNGTIMGLTKDGGFNNYSISAINMKKNINYKLYQPEKKVDKIDNCFDCEYFLKNDSVMCCWIDFEQFKKINGYVKEAKQIPPVWCSINNKK